MYLSGGSRQTIAAEIGIEVDPKSVSQRRFPANHSFSDAARQFLRSVSQRRLPANHSSFCGASISLNSVSQRRLPANHSVNEEMEAYQVSVSQRRLPANHSYHDIKRNAQGVYLSGGSRQTIAH